MPPTRRSLEAAEAEEMENADADADADAGISKAQVVQTKFRVSWNKILSNFQRHFFLTNDCEKTKLHFANKQKVDCMKGSWALLSMVDAMAQFREPPRHYKIKFPSVQVLILSIEEVFEQAFLPDDAEIEIYNEFIEWQDYKNLERTLLQNTSGQIRKQQLVHAALEILRQHGTLQDNIEFVVKTALEGFGEQYQENDGSDSD